jgi:hypothetical protein
VAAACDAGEEYLGALRGVGGVRVSFVQRCEDADGQADERPGHAEVGPPAEVAAEGTLFCYGGADGAPANVIALLACGAKSSGQAVADVRCDADGFIEGEGCAGKHGGAFAGGGLGEEDFFVEAG